jgi:hypothetical protein
VVLALGVLVCHEISMTPEQKKDDERLQRYIEREQLCSVMNNTKWREMVEALQSIARFQVKFRVKCLRDAQPPLDYWQGSFPYHVPTFKVIEWLDINPLMKIHRGQLLDDEVIDFTDQVISALELKNIPHLREDEAIRIWGYIRSPK